MKASVITLHTVDNYGSVMQTYATGQILKKLGYEVEFIDYWRKDNLPKQRAIKLLNSSSLQKLKPFWGLNASTKSIAIFLLSKILEKKKSPMWKFLEKNIQLTPIKYSSFEELVKNPPISDVYITGSDQVWNSIWNQGVDKSYFLDFAPKNKPRIAFSASIGRETLDNTEILETKELLVKYKAISVREQSAVELLKSMGIDSTLILDPTLMLDADEWRKMASSHTQNQPYLLVYQLNPNLEMDEYAKQLAKKKGWKLLRIGFGKSDHKKSGICITLPSVEEFLELFCEASCILTDSFHATAFSLNLGIDFISVLPKRFGTRITNILKLTNTENRLLTSFNDFSIVDEKIDKMMVKNILNQERINGYHWLENSLKCEE